MNDPATSLDRLHDLVLPAAVPWWPPAPGWYGVMGIVFVLIIYFVHLTWKSWKANAYRREALRQLTQVKDAIALAELLRCTALAIAPRQVIAEKTGSAWTDWLIAQFPEPMPDSVRTQLTAGVYGRSTADSDVHALREYAVRWIKGHRRPPILDHPPQC